MNPDPFGARPGVDYFRKRVVVDDREGHAAGVGARPGSGEGEIRRLVHGRDEGTCAVEARATGGDRLAKLDMHGVEDAVACDPEPVHCRGAEYVLFGVLVEGYS